MKLSPHELAQVEAFIARGEVETRAAGADAPLDRLKPVEYTELVARRRTRLGHLLG